MHACTASLCERLHSRAQSILLLTRHQHLHSHLHTDTTSSIIPASFIELRRSCHDSPCPQHQSVLAATPRSTWQNRSLVQLRSRTTRHVSPASCATNASIRRCWSNTMASRIARTVTRSILEQAREDLPKRSRSTLHHQSRHALLPPISRMRREARYRHHLGLALR